MMLDYVKKPYKITQQSQISYMINGEACKSPLHALRETSRSLGLYNKNCEQVMQVFVNYSAKKETHWQKVVVSTLVA